MNKTKLIIIGSIVVIAGVGGYFGYQWYKKNKKKKEEDKGSGSQDSGSSSSSSSSSSTSVSSPTSSSTSTSTAFSFPSTWTTKEGDAFRQWVRANYPDYAKQISLDASGSLNQYVDTAYKKYGTQYQNALKGQSASKDIRFKVGEKVKTNKSVVVTPFRIVNNNFSQTGEPNVTLSANTSLNIARNPILVDGKIAYRVNPIGWTGVDENTFYTIYQDHLKIA